MKSIVRWLITLAFAGAIFYVSSRPVSGKALFPYSDKVFHMLIYAILAYLCVWSMRSLALRKWLRIAIFTFLIVTLYGICMEIYQMYIPERSAEIGDALANMVGAFIGTYLYVYFFCIIPVRKNLKRNDKKGDIR